MIAVAIIRKFVEFEESLHNSLAMNMRYEDPPSLVARLSLPYYVGRKSNTHERRECPGQVRLNYFVLELKVPKKGIHSNEQLVVVFAVAPDCFVRD